MKVLVPQAINCKVALNLHETHLDGGVQLPF